MCLRAGDAVASDSQAHTLKLDQPFSGNQGLHIVFKSYKYNSPNTPLFHLKASLNNDCTVTQIQQYLKHWGQQAGPLFITKDASPVTMESFSGMLKTCIALLNFPPSHYNTYSFRIGRATQLEMDRCPTRDIQATGRWRSSANLKYIRPTHFTLPQ